MAGLPPHPGRPGTESCYMRGCRRPECKAARSRAVRERKERKAETGGTLLSLADKAAAKAGKPTTVEAAILLGIADISDDWRTQARARMAVALARLIDKGGSSTGTHVKQLEDLLPLLRQKEPDDAGTSGPAAWIGSRGRVDS